MTHHYNAEHHHNGKAVVGTLLAGVFLTALAVGAEQVATGRDHRSFRKRTKVVSRIREAERSVHVMPGCRANGEYIGEMLDPHIQHIGTTHHEAYAEHDFDLEETKQTELEARAKDMGRAAVVYCLSMGGLKFAKSLTDPEYREKFGKIDTLILDSSPADVEDLDSGTRLAMFASRVLPPSWIVSRMYRRVMRRAAKRLEPHSPKVTDEQVYGHRISSADTPLHAVRGQARFINETHLKDGELAEVAKDIGAIYYVSSSHDAVVNRHTAYEKYNRIFGGRVIQIVDYDRDPKGHAAGPEYPELIVSLMEGRYPLMESAGQQAASTTEPQQTIDLSPASAAA